MKLMPKLGLAWGPEIQRGAQKRTGLENQAASPGRKGEVNNYIHIATFSAWMKE